MHILILNWRDIRNPSGGGAEQLTHEIAKRWVQEGHTVTLFSSEFHGGKKDEYVDGVHIIRQGFPDIRTGPFSVHFRAFIYYMSIGRKIVDCVIDEIHGVPFFTPLFVKQKNIALICEVASALWYKMHGRVFGTIGSIVESVFLRYIYRQMTFLTISPSTEMDLIAKGIPKNAIHVLPMGLSVPVGTTMSKKERIPTLIFVGRLCKSKGIEDTLMAFSLLRKKIRAALWIIGRGEMKYTHSLMSRAKDLGVDGDVHFLGFVSQEEKYKLMGRSHILLVPSFKEGWGLIVPEAGYVGTPSVVYNTNGLRDIVIHGETGSITSENTPRELVNSVLQLLKDKKKYNQICQECAIRSRLYTWDKTAASVLSIIENI